MQFIKMHGLGNDFVMVQEKDLPQGDLALLAQRVCDRHRGIGADGLVILGQSAMAPWRMQIYNSDGTEAEMCGNALRCAGKYLYDNGLVSETSFDLESYGGIIRPLKLLVKDNLVQEVTVDMGEPILEGSRIPVAISQEEIVDAKIQVGAEEFSFTAVSMGNPHCVIFTQELSQVPLGVWGPALEKHQLFPRKTNVEFAQVIGPNKAQMLVWERGVGPTQACGSGACAVLVAGVLTKVLARTAEIELPGGILSIEWNDQNRILMTGPAETVFNGTW